MLLKILKTNPPVRTRNRLKYMVVLQKLCFFRLTYQKLMHFLRNTTSYLIDSGTNGTKAMNSTNKCNDFKSLKELQYIVCQAV